MSIPYTQNKKIELTATGAKEYACSSVCALAAAAELASRAAASLGLLAARRLLFSELRASATFRLASRAASWALRTAGHEASCLVNEY
jgi:hypothetical protein